MQSLLARLKASKQQEDSNGLDSVRDGVNGDITDTNTRIPNGLPFGEILVSDAEPNTGRLEDDIAIDFVMETNKVQRKNLLSPSSPIQRPLSKTSKKHGSRTSLNSAALSERDDLETINLDSDEELPKEEEYSPSQAWAAFEDCVKNIDNSSADYFVKKPKPNFVSSGTFQQVMVDMYGNTEYGNTKGYTVLKQKLNNMGKSLKLASRMMQAAVSKGQEEREKAEEEPEEVVEPESPEVQAEPDSVKKVFAKRGWKVLKREMNENAMENKTQTKKLNWSMLQHTVKQMSNTEKTRQDLYERYGIVPRTMEDGSVVCENMMLSERARAQLQSGDGRRSFNHGRSASSMHFRSRSQMGFQNKRVDSANSGKSLKLPHLNRSKPRPFTAK